MDEKKSFTHFQGQTTPFPLGIHVDTAKGMYITDKSGKRYLDLVAGVSACILGHSHPAVVNAIKEQANKYLHVMVYGEFIQDPQLNLAKKIASLLPPSLNCTYFVNSGTEAIEASMKLAKRITGRSEMISCKDSYHGSTHGTLSIIGYQGSKLKFRPLLPDCNQIRFNDIGSLNKITSRTAAVIIEPVQGASGFITPEEGFLEAIRLRCNKTGTFLIFDEIQTCFGRTGHLFGIDTFQVVPDILCMAKGMGGGMSIGSFTTSTENMHSLRENPILGHITTFGGHPISCAASLATLNILCESSILDEIPAKEALFRTLLVHSRIKYISGRGLMLGIHFFEAESAVHLVKRSMEMGIITFFFLHTKTAVRLSPPLIISELEIRKSAKIILSILDESFFLTKS
ncbi:MAG: aspartate aminotransferase family protein [Flavobacteriales bacterium]|nr:aspartate aminotransferase family protein [Flavobacteriales bacterium]|tara:strand:+ start:19238 stop:20437 length:1200 start_codon:yes stop_codon:yes gene_type:complete